MWTCQQIHVPNTQNDVQHKTSYVTICSNGLFKWLTEKRIPCALFSAPWAWPNTRSTRQWCSGMIQQQTSDGDDDDRLLTPPQARTAPLAAPSSSRGLAYIRMSENRKNVRSSIRPTLDRFDTFPAETIDSAVKHRTLVSSKCGGKVSATILQILIWLQ